MLRLKGCTNCWIRCWTGWARHLVAFLLEATSTLALEVCNLVMTCTPWAGGVLVADIPLVISSRTTMRKAAIVAADISTLEIGSWSSVGKLLGIISDAWAFVLAWASRSGVPSGAGLFVEPCPSPSTSIIILRNPFSKSAVKSCQPAFFSVAWAMEVASLYCSYLSHALDPAFLGFSLANWIGVLPSFNKSICSFDDGMTPGPREEQRTEQKALEHLSQIL